MVKQTLRSSGANVTEKHIEDVSLCSLFLMEPAKKADRAFGLAPRSTMHTVCDASVDVNKIASHLLQHQVTIQLTRS